MAMATISATTSSSSSSLVTRPRLKKKTLQSVASSSSSSPTYLRFRNGNLSSFSLSSVANLNFQIQSRSICAVASLSSSSSTISTQPLRQYEFYDNGAELELRVPLGEDQSSDSIFVDASETSLIIIDQAHGSRKMQMEVNPLYDKIKPGETIWYIDEDQLVVTLKKHDNDLTWPDLLETWESLLSGARQLLKGVSIYIIGESTEMNWKVAEMLAMGLGYTPFATKDLLESYGNQTIDTWLKVEGSDSLATAEAEVFECLSSHVRAVVATLGGSCSAAGHADKWQHLHAGFTIWLKHKQSSGDEQKSTYNTRNQAMSNSDVIVELENDQDAKHVKTAAQASLRALKKLILSDKQLPGKKSLYIRLGCRGDWPDIQAPGWDPSSQAVDQQGH